VIVRYAACDDKDVNQCTSATSLQKCSSSCAPVSSCGDWISNCGETVWNCHKDVCGTSSTRFNLNDKIGGAQLSVGNTITESTCGLGTGFTGNAEDWLEVTTSGYGFLEVALAGPSPCDWDFWVYDASSGAFKFSGETGSCSEQSSMELPAGTYKIKVRQYNGNGNGQGSVRASLIPPAPGTCAVPKDLGSLNDYGNQVSGSTVALSSSVQDDIFKFTVNMQGYLIVNMDGPGTACDWDFWVNADGYCGIETTYITRSPVEVGCDESASVFSVTGEKYIKVHRNTGDGLGSINVRLVECVANDAADGECPSAKPYCNGNTCVGCISSGTECKGTDGTYNTFCPLTSTTPNYILPKCTLNTCICEGTCGSGINRNALCASEYCCTGETPQGPDAILPGEATYTCINNNGRINPWLCTQ